MKINALSIKKNLSSDVYILVKMAMRSFEKLLQNWHYNTN
jgi:hypothetical protein